MKVAIYDIEAWDLSPEFAPIICVSILNDATNEMKTFRNDWYVKNGWADSMEDDYQLCVDVKEYLSQFHMTCGWYSKGYDIMLLNTRLALHGEELMPSKLHLDGTWFFRGWRGIKPKTSKLKHVAEFFNFEQKPEVAPKVWLHAREGQKAAMDEVVERCEADTRIARDCINRALDLGIVKNIQKYP